MTPIDPILPVITTENIGELFGMFRIPNDLDEADETIFRVIEVFRAAQEEIRVLRAVKARNGQK
ncbi:MAG: hypothetical protein J3T61_11865 [Candidatus Brocadiales bacterium]|nr:hypothetical protein [Candidatus Bathyanammoxibius sp.]